MKWINKGHELDQIAQIVCDSSKRIMLWGVANIGQAFFEMCHEKRNIVGVIDSNEQMQGMAWNGMYVCAPNSLDLKNQDIIVVTTSAYDQIKPYLMDMGFVENQTFFDYFIYEQIFQWYENKKLYTRRIDISLTERCTLKCEKCNMFMPYFVCPTDMDYEDVIVQIDEYFDLVDYVESFNLLGGEPLLYKKLSLVVDYIGKNYRNRMEHLKIFTNGTLMPDQNLIASCREWNVEVQISDYTNEVAYAKKMKEVCQKMEQESVSFYMQASSEWGDFGFPENPNQIPDSKVEQYFDGCRAPFRGLYNHRVYFCHLETSAIRAGLFQDNENDSFDLRSADEQRKLLFLEFDNGYNEQGGISFCAVCRGCYPQNKLFVPAAKQK